MLPAAPDAAPALNTRTRTSARGLTFAPLAVVAGWDDPGAAADVGAGVVVGVGDVAEFVPAGAAPGRRRHTHRDPGSARRPSIRTRRRWLRTRCARLTVSGSYDNASSFSSNAPSSA